MILHEERDFPFFQWASSLDWAIKLVTLLNGSILPHNNKLTLTVYFFCLPHPKHLNPFANTTTIVTDPDYVVDALFNTPGHTETGQTVLRLWPLHSGLLLLLLLCPSHESNVKDVHSKLHLWVAACGFWWWYVVKRQLSVVAFSSVIPVQLGPSSR